jgi:hypothetical protein
MAARLGGRGASSIRRLTGPIDDASGLSRSQTQLDGGKMSCLCNDGPIAEGERQNAAPERRDYEDDTSVGGLVSPPYSPSSRISSSR